MPFYNHMTGRGRKHKRAKRGSVERGQSDPKRTNMAAVEGVTFVTEPPTTEDHASQRTQSKGLTRNIVWTYKSQ